MLSAIFTCMCNYNTKICGMAMAQTVVPVYTIPYWVQQSLWESICRIIPSIAHTSGSELRSFEPAAPRNTPVEQAITVPAAGNSGVPKLGTAKSNDPRAPQPHHPPIRRMPLRKCAKLEFFSEFLRPDQSGLLRKCFSTYRLSTSRTIETLPAQGRRKPARPSKPLLQPIGVIPGRSSTSPR